MPFCKTVDAVVQQYHVDVDIASHGVDEVVSADSQTVAIAANLPYCKVRISHFQSRSYRRRTSVYGLHGVGIHVIRQARRASDARNHRRLMWRNAYFRHCLM